MALQNKTLNSKKPNDDKKLIPFHPVIYDLLDPTTRESSLLFLSKEREKHPDLAPVLWHSFGSVTVLIQEILSIYPYLFSPEELSDEVATRCCYTLAIMQSIAMHPQTKRAFINAQIPLYIYPIISVKNYECIVFEKVRLTSLGVMGTLLQTDDAETVKFLIKTEIVPVCIGILRDASEISKILAAYILQRLLVDRQGLEYICETGERFQAISDVLSETVQKMLKLPSIRLLKHVIHCYLCLSANPKAKTALRSCMPTALRTNAFKDALKKDFDAQKWLNRLIQNLAFQTDLIC